MNITGIILAGGKSTRMDGEKPLLMLGGKTLLERTIELLRNFFRDILIIADEADKYKMPETENYCDIYPGRGPLSGIHSGLFHSKTEKNFFISCDYPFMSPIVIDYIFNYESNELIVVPDYKGYIHSLCGMYNKACLDAIEEIIKKPVGTTISRDKKFMTRNIFDKVKTELIEMDELPFLDENTFFNMNTIEDYEKAKVLIADEK